MSYNTEQLHFSQHADTIGGCNLSPHNTTEKERQYGCKRCIVMDRSAGKHTRTHIVLCFCILPQCKLTNSDYLATGSNTDQIL